MTVHIDVTRIAETDSGTGIQRVVRQLSRHWYQLPGRKVRLNFVAVSEAGVIVNEWDWAKGAIEGFVPELSPDETSFRAGDVYFGLDLVLPPRGLDRSQLDYLRKGGVHVAIMVCDILPLTHPQWFRFRSTFSFWWWAQMLPAASLLLTISEASRQEICTKLRRYIVGSRPIPRVEVVTLSGEPELGNHASGEREEVGLQVPERLFVSIGTMEPRKGYPEVLEAFEELWASGLEVSWWIFGRRGWRIARLRHKLQTHPEWGARLRWIPNASDGEIYRTLERARALIANSFDEGLGLPLLEARHFKLPIIARDIPVFRDFAGNDAVFVSSVRPNSASLARAIRELTNTKPANSTRRHATTFPLRWSDGATDLEYLLSNVAPKPD